MSEKNAALLNVLHDCVLDSYFSEAQKPLNNMSINIYENKLIKVSAKGGVVLTPGGQMTLMQLNEARFRSTVVPSS